MRQVSLCADEQLLIGEGIRVTVCEIDGDEVVLHIEYPEDAQVCASGECHLAHALV